MTREQVIEAVARAMYPSLVWGTDYEAVPFNEAWVRPRYAHLRQMIESGVKLALTAVLDATAEPQQDMIDAAYVAADQAEEVVDNCVTIWRAMHAAMRRNLTGGDDGEGE